MKLIPACAVAVAACATGVIASPVLRLEVTPLAGSVVNPGVAATHSLRFLVTATSVQGVGAVSGFADMRVATTNLPSEASLSARVLSPFNTLAFSNGTVGDSIVGLSGAQQVLPPTMPIDPRLDLFVLTYSERSFIEREIDVTLSGRAGVFTSMFGQSTVPYPALDSVTFRISVVPGPAVVTLITFGLIRRRRAGR